MAPTRKPVAMTGSCRTVPSTRPALRRCRTEATISAPASPSRKASRPPVSPSSQSGAMARGTKRTISASRISAPDSVPRTARSARARRGPSPSPAAPPSLDRVGGGRVGPAARAVAASGRSSRRPAAAEQRARLPRGDHRAGDQHAGPAELVLALLGELHRRLDRVVQPRLDRHPLRRRTPPPRSRPGRPPASAGATNSPSPRSRPGPAPARRACRRTSLSPSTATTPISRRNENDSASAATVAAIPCGLCAASTSTVGALRSASSRPGELTPSSASRTTSTSITPVSAPAPRNASTAASATAAFSRLVGAVQRQEELVVHPAEALHREHLPADRDRPRRDAELGALPGHRRADLGHPPQQHLRGRRPAAWPGRRPSRA